MVEPEKKKRRNELTQEECKKTRQEAKKDLLTTSKNDEHIMYSKIYEMRKPNATAWILGEKRRVLFVGDWGKRREGFVTLCVMLSCSLTWKEPFV